MKYFFALLLLASYSANAQIYTSETTKIEVNGDSVTLNGIQFILGEELVSEAYTVGTSSLTGGDSTSCRIKVNIAKKGANGSIILLSANMAKVSKSQGLLCWIANSSVSFEAPHSYLYAKLDISNDDSTITLSQLKITDGLFLPILPLEDLLDENLILNQDLIAYQEQNPSRVSLNIETLRIGE